MFEITFECSARREDHASPSRYNNCAIGGGMFADAEGVGPLPGGKGGMAGTCCCMFEDAEEEELEEAAWHALWHAGEELDIFT